MRQKRYCLRPFSSHCSEMLCTTCNLCTVVFRKLLQHQSGHLMPFKGAGKNSWKCTSTSPVSRLGMVLKHDNNVDLSTQQTHSHTHTDDGSSRLLRNVCKYLPYYTEPHLSIRNVPSQSPRQPHISSK
jgi:hypothetical protein